MHCGWKLGMLILLLVLAGCSSGSDGQARLVPAPGNGNITSTSPGNQPLTEPGPDHALLAMLQAELERVLSISDTQRSAAAAADPRLRNLNYVDGAFQWYYDAPGDYDQNGEVNAADLVPLASHFGESGQFDYLSIQAVIDGDGTSCAVKHNGSRHGHHVVEIGQLTRVHCIQLDQVQVLAARLYLCQSGRLLQTALRTGRSGEVEHRGLAGQR